MKRILALALLLASACFGAQTTISDNVSSVGNIVRDSIVSASVSWNSFTAADSTSVTAGSQTVTIAADGSFSLALSPNAGTTGVYTVVYTGKDGRTFTETLNVPVSGSAVTLAGARVQGAVLRASDGNQLLMPGVAPVYSSSSGGSSPLLTIAKLPSAASSNGQTFWIGDSSDGTCGNGAGTQVVACKSNGTTWVAQSSGSGITLQQAAAAAPVQSVAGHTGVVTLSQSDISNFASPAFPSSMIAHYDFHEGTGTTAHDVSGDGYDLTFATSTHSPTWTTGGGLSFVAANRQYAYASTNLNPSSIVSACALVNTQANKGINAFFPNIIMSTSGSAQWSMATSPSSVSFSGWQPSSMANSAATAVSWDTAFGLVQVCIVRGSSADKIFINGIPASGYYAAGGTLGTTPTGQFTLGGSPGAGDGGSSGLTLAGNYNYDTGTTYDVSLYSTALTASQVYQVYNSTITYQNATNAFFPIFPNYNTAATSQYLCVGDSLTAGSDSSVIGGYCVASRLTPIEPFTINNVGIGGITTTNMLQMATQSVGGQSELRDYAPSAKFNVVSFWGGTNDLCNGANATPSQVLTNTLNFVRYAKSMGWTVLVKTMLSRVGTGTGGATCDSLKNQLNPLLRASIPGSGAYLVDVAADPNFGADNAYSNSTWFNSGDKIHLTDAGYIKVAGYEATMLNRITQGGGVKTITANATAYGDEMFRANPASGSITVTLPDALAMTGMTITVKNIQSSGSNTVTLSAVNSETIDGAGTLAAANLATKVVRSNGVNWDVVE